MLKKKIEINIDDYPCEFENLIKDSLIYDSSCSPEAKVIYIDKDGGYFLKKGKKDSLKKENDMGRFFYQKGLGAEIVNYISLEDDWLLTKRVEGEDCTFYKYLDYPEKLADTIAELLGNLHSFDYIGCPVENRIKSYLDSVDEGYRNGRFDQFLFSPISEFKSPDEAYSMVNEYRAYLKNDTLIHGDYCLPNIILDDWKFSGFIDLGNGGVGDRHIDLFWGAWTLWFNLKTDKYIPRFLDAYGRERINTEMLNAIAAMETFG